jgi:hypothetical protein
MAPRMAHSRPSASASDITGAHQPPSFEEIRDLVTGLGLRPAARLDQRLDGQLGIFQWKQGPGLTTRDLAIGQESIAIAQSRDVESESLSPGFLQFLGERVGELGPRHRDHRADGILDPFES